jgi:secreted PhoX family phosphatase
MNLSTTSRRSLSRRSFLGQAGLVSFAFASLERFVSSDAHAGTMEEPDLELREDFYETLDLPKGFEYTVLSQAGETMNDGFLVPGKHDGMAAFAGSSGRTILVRNHEMEAGATEYSPFGRRRALLRNIDRSKLYDAGHGKKPGLGGTTTLVFDTKTQRLEKHFLSLAGTYRNCAGGVTPWNTWITCEEDVSRPNEDGQHPEDPMEKEHGYNFEVPVSDTIALADPVPLKAMGRFRHEAIAVDPRTGIVYQTEDRGDGLLYRYIPNEKGVLHKGGRLQALKLHDLSRADTRNWHQQAISRRQSLPVDWVDVRDVEAPLDDDLRYQGFFEKGAARFARAEGCWFGRNTLFVACTNGGRKKKGQIWRYVPSLHEGETDEEKTPGTLELFIEPNDGRLVENCDNLTMAPWGDLIICEDGVSPQHLVGITPEGRLYRFARTTLSEFAGACFSPDGSTLFVNIQDAGLTVAITGPWQKLQHAAA